MTKILQYQNFQNVFFSKITKSMESQNNCTSNAK